MLAQFFQKVSLPFSLPPLSTMQRNKSLVWSHPNSYSNKLPPSSPTPDTSPSSCLDLPLSGLPYCMPLPSPQPTAPGRVQLSKYSFAILLSGSNINSFKDLRNLT